MSRLPVTKRTLVIEKNRDGTMRLADYYLVNTSLGEMAEPRTMVRTVPGGPTGGIQNEDTRETAFDEIRIIDDANRGQNLSFIGNQWPVAPNASVGVP